jgi:hypothetical protein
MMIQAAPASWERLGRGCDSHQDGVWLASRAACRGLEVLGGAEDLRVGDSGRWSI